MSNLISQYSTEHIKEYLDIFLGQSNKFVAFLLNDPDYDIVSRDATINELVNLELSNDVQYNYGRQEVFLNPATIIDLVDNNNNLILDSEGNTIPVATATAEKIVFESNGGTWEQATHICYLRGAELTIGSTQGKIVRTDRTLPNGAVELDHEEKFNATPTFRMSATVPSS